VIHNLGISRQLAVTISIGTVCVSLVVAIRSGIDATTVMAFVGVLTALVAALKSTESADTASKTHNIVQLTASQNAAIHQTLVSHCGDMCPLDACPLRSGNVA
jgi:hypothetical protein